VGHFVSGKAGDVGAESDLCGGDYGKVGVEVHGIIQNAGPLRRDGAVREEVTAFRIGDRRGNEEVISALGAFPREEKDEELRRKIAEI
jgi:hypothetical protein